MTLLRPEPALARPAAPGGDGVTFLTAYLVLLTLLPSKLVLGPLGATGAPATLLAAAGALWWLVSRVTSDAPSPVPSALPVRRAVLGLAAAVLASYVVAGARSATDAEVNSADAALVMLTGWVGVVLVAGDGVPDLRRLHTLLERVVAAVGVVAVIGLLQFATGHTLVDVSLPGFTVNNGAAGLQDRDGFSRVIGTTIHPIEFGVVTAALLPLCVHHARHRAGPPWRRGWPLVAVSLAVPLSVSRSAVVAAVVALLCAAPTWSRAGRRMAAVYGVLLGCVLFVAVPGMLGTLAKMFVGIEEDSSAQSRTGGFALAGEFIGRSPWFGRGFKTFLPEYQTLDNQYLGLLIDVGIVGTLAMVAVLVTGIALAVRTRRRTEDPRIRSLAGALGASVTAVAVSLAFFDALSFPMLTGLLFLLLGSIEALARHARTAA